MRAFIAVDAPLVALVAELQREILKAGGWSSHEVKPVGAENFHFTLNFLGEINDGDVARISESLSSIRFQRFPVFYSHAGAFPEADSARVVWLGVDNEAGERLGALAEQVNSRMEGLGFRPDRRFSPHLTLLRARDRPLHARSVLDRFQTIPKSSGLDANDESKGARPDGTVNSIHLKKSELRSSGPVYSNVYTVEASEAG